MCSDLLVLIRTLSGPINFIKDEILKNHLLTILLNGTMYLHHFALLPPVFHQLLIPSAAAIKINCLRITSASSFPFSFPWCLGYISVLHFSCRIRYSFPSNGETNQTIGEVVLFSLYTLSKVQLGLHYQENVEVRLRAPQSQRETNKMENTHLTELCD